MAETIGVVIVAFNRLLQLQEALKSFDSQTASPAFILVVDNASTDGTAAFLEKWKSEPDSGCPRLVIHEDKNLGGSGGFHDGLKHAIQLGAKWVWLSDDDAYPESNCIELANQWISKHDTRGIAALCGSVICDGAIDISHRRNIEARGLRVTEKQIPLQAYESDFELNSLSFVGAIIKTDAANRVGLPLSDYFIWYDDTEYSLRLGVAGKIVCVPAIRVNHPAPKGNESMTWKGYYGQRNCLDMIRAHFPRAVYLYSRLRAKAKSAKLYLKDVEIGRMYFAAIRDQKLGKRGINKKYAPGMKITSKLQE